ncbi:SNARE associated Golgi protein [Acanthamoeba castellanii str. Neff]|uniref:SNARE associated Golgi protein n=1 Tax=Acanthamoeba castellanii (strain ATCC 30010 / Neff) TaxID=1257118 RepID=L8GTI0_ACACF|nr:SNARE associated Golgi protein [Acanthamoeba castellanii str. Neff]ELR15913.1 SNARE associated Golgi protein [Acanthamoeba castellanii str. Neff]
MSFDDINDCESLFSATSPFFLHSPASTSPFGSSNKAKSFVLSCSSTLRKRTKAWLHDARHAWWPLVADLAPKLQRISTLASSFGKDITRALVLITFATCIILFGVHFSSFQHLVIIFLQWIRTLGMLGGIIYVFATALSNLVFIPSAVIAFVLGRTLFRSWVSSLARQYPKVALMDQAIGKKAVGWKIVLLLRLSPMLPYNVLNYVLSVTRVQFMDYFLASTIGMFPGVAVFTYFGSISHDLSSIFSFSSKGMSGMDDDGSQTLIIYSGFFFSVVAFVLLSYFAANAIKKELKKIEEENEANEAKDKELDQLEQQREKLQEEEAAKAKEADAAMNSTGQVITLRQIDEALFEVRNDTHGSVVAKDERPVFEQNRSCGMRKNLSWVDSSMA